MKKKHDRRGNKSFGSANKAKSRVNRRADERLSARIKAYDKAIASTTTNANKTTGYRKPGALKRY